MDGKQAAPRIILLGNAKGGGELSISSEFYSIEYDFHNVNNLNITGNISFYSSFTPLHDVSM